MDQHTGPTATACTVTALPTRSHGRSPKSRATAPAWWRTRAALVAVLVGSLLAAALPAASATALPPPNGWGQMQTSIPTDSPTGRCLDLDAGTQYNTRTNVQLYNCHAANHPDVGYQYWQRISVGYNRPATEFKLRNTRTGKCLTYSPGSTGTAPVWAESCDRPGQGWTTHAQIAFPDTYVALNKIRAVESQGTEGQCLDVQNPSGPHRGGIDLFPCSVGEDYVWWWY